MVAASSLGAAVQAARDFERAMASASAAITNLLVVAEPRINAAALASAVGKVGDDFPCVGTALAEWLAS